MKESFIIRYPSTDAGKKAWNKQYGMNQFLVPYLMSSGCSGLARNDGECDQCGTHPKEAV